MIKKFILVTLALFTALAVNAQYKVTVQLKDAASGEPVGFATVSVVPEKGPAKYALSSHEGVAQIEKVRPGKYTLKAEIMGYVTKSQSITVQAADLNLGIIKMEQDTQVLDAASVSATGNPIIIKKDTVEYNASSYKISDDNVLEDLLKKLPGVEVDESGTITANGETITKITIDGKTFFLDDPQLASKNLPAKIIEKVKVVKKKSEQAEFTGIDDGNDETVIDLSVKRGMMNGLFGSVMAGGGHDIPSKQGTVNDYRWQGAFMGGKFTKSSQISIIANANNTNNRGFNDLSGSMMSSMMGSGGGMGRGRGGNGRTGNGIVTSWMGGLNGNWDLFDKKMELAGNYLYNGTETVVQESTYKETYLDNQPTIVYRTGNYLTNDLSGNPMAQALPDVSTKFTDGHRFGIQLEHKFSENTSILFRPQFNFGTGRYNETSRFETDNLLDDGSLSAVNRGFSHTEGNNKNWQANGFFLFRQRLGIPGRTLSLSLRYNLSNNKMQGLNQSFTETLGDYATAVVNEYIDQFAKQRSINSRLVYTEPLGGNFYMEGSYSVNYSQNQTEKSTYDYLGGTLDKDGYVIQNAEGAQMEYNPTYSNQILNRSFTQNIGLAFMYQEDKLRAQLGASAIPTRTHNETMGYQPYDDKRWNFSPRAMLFYDFNDNSNVRLFYFGRSSQPSTSQLLPVMDNSNPLAMSLGNPNLNPYFNHGLRSDLEYSNKKTFFTLRVHLEGNYTKDPIVSAMWYDNASVTYSLPVNGKDSFNGNVRVVVNAPIAKSNFSISNITRVTYSNSSSFVGGRSDMSGYYDTDIEGKQSFSYKRFFEDYGENLDKTDFFTANTTRSLTVLERLRGTYRSDNLEIIMSGRTRLNKPWYTLQKAVDPTWANQVNGSIKWTLGRSGFEISTDADYNWYRGYTTPQPSEFVWNASVSKQLFRRQATLSLKAYDILDQAKNLTVTDTANYHSEVRNNTLGRYVILSFTWRFGNFGKAGQQMRSRMGNGGPGRMGGPMGGRGGRMF